MKRAGAVVGMLCLFLTVTLSAQASTGATKRLLAPIGVRPGALGPVLFCTPQQHSGCGSTAAGSTLTATLTISHPRPHHVYYFSLPAYSAQDKTGSGRGWSIQFQATRFTCLGGHREHCGHGDGIDMLPYGSLDMLPPSVACAPHLACVRRELPPAIVIKGSTGIDEPNAVGIASACSKSCASGPTGMGTYNFTPGAFTGGKTVLGQLRLTTGSSPLGPTTYSSTLTISIAAGS